MIRAVLFDLDGTVLDTKESILQSFEYTLRAIGARGIDREHITPLIGKSLEEIYGQLVPEGTVADLALMHRTWQVENQHLYKAFPGSAAVLAALRKKEIKTAAVTTRQKTVLLSLKRAGLENVFDVVVTGETTVRVKPDPESLLAALDELGVVPAEAVMVGDTEVDIQAGKNAGTRTIGVTHGFRSREELEPHGADYLVDDILEVPRIIHSLRF